MIEYASYNSTKPNTNVERIIFRTRFEADLVYDALSNDIELFGRTSIARLYYWCGKTYTDKEKSVGWLADDWPKVKKISGAGYMIIFPEAKEIEPLF